MSGKSLSDRKVTHRNPAELLSESIRAANAPAIPPPPGYKLDALALGAFGDIVNARARAEWTESDLHVAAEAAQLTAKLNAVSARIRKLALATKDTAGRKMVPPEVATYRALSEHRMKLLRFLTITPSSIGDPDENKKARKANRRARMVANGKDPANSVRYTNAQSAPSSAPADAPAQGVPAAAAFDDDELLA